MQTTTPTSARTTLPSFPMSSDNSNFDGIIKIALPIFAIIASFSLFPLEPAIVLSVFIGLLAFTWNQCTNSQSARTYMDLAPKSVKTKTPVTSSKKLENVSRIHFIPVTRIHFSPDKPPTFVQKIATYVSPIRNTPK